MSALQKINYFNVLKILFYVRLRICENTKFTTAHQSLFEITRQCI